MTQTLGSLRWRIIGAGPVGGADLCLFGLGFDELGGEALAGLQTPWIPFRKTFKTAKLRGGCRRFSRDRSSGGSEINHDSTGFYLQGDRSATYAERAADCKLARLGGAQRFSHLLMQRDGIARHWSCFVAEHNLVLTPTSARLPFPHGFDVASKEGAAATKIMQRPLFPANLLGVPSACVPAGRDEATGLPIGVLLTGQRFREDICLDAAEAIEARAGLATPDPIHR